MNLKKKIPMIFMIILILSTLVACGSSNKAGGQDYNSQEAENLMPLSEGLEKHSLWIELEDQSPTKNSIIKSVFVFEEDKVEYYDLSDGELNIEESINMSDDEFIKYASKESNKKYNEHLETVTSKPLNLSPEEYEAIKEEASGIVKFGGGKKHTQIFGNSVPFMVTSYTPEDLFLEVANERSDSPSDYSLDMTDQKMLLQIKNATSYIANAENVRSEYSNYNISKLFPIYITGNMSGKEELDSLYDDLARQLEEYGKFEEEDGSELKNPQSFVPDPLKWETEDIELTFKANSPISKTILDTKFSGYLSDRGAFITRVDDSFLGFRLD